MEILETIKPMLSDSYADRIRAEYWQLDCRLKKLQMVLLGRNASIPKDNHLNKLLKEQEEVMLEYKTILEERAEIEDIDLAIKIENPFDNLTEDIHK